MKLRVHYKYGNKVRKATSGPGFPQKALDEWTKLISDTRIDDGMASFTGFKPTDFAVPARDIILMEVIG